MAIFAHVGGLENKYLAALSDGRRLEGADLRALADALHHAGVSSEELCFGLRAGHRLLTSGQQVALYAEIRNFEGKYRKSDRNMA